MSGDFERLRERHPVPWTYERGEYSVRDWVADLWVIRDAAGATVIECVAGWHEEDEEPEYSPEVEVTVAALVALVNDAASGDR